MYLREGDLMRINKTNNLQFTGIYKVPLNEKNLKDVEEYVIPVYGYIRHQPIIFFMGENPYKIFMDAFIDNIAEASGGSTNWLKMNAAKYNMETDLIDNKFFHIITLNDVPRLKNFFNETSPKKLSFIDKIKHKFKKLEVPHLPEHLPTHLKYLQATFDEIKKKNAEFEKFTQGKRITVNDSHDLLLKMLLER